jgi:hypothetical protein
VIMKPRRISFLIVLFITLAMEGLGQSAFQSKEDSLDFMNRRRFWTSLRWPDVEQLFQVAKDAKVVTDEPQGPPVQLSPNATYPDKKAIRIGNATTSEPYVAVSPSDPLNFICAYHHDTLNTTRAGATYTTNQGVTWNNSDVPSFWYFYSKRSDPVLSFDAEGQAYYVYLDYHPQDGQNKQNSLVVMRSPNKGAGWTERYIVVNESQSNTTTFHEKPWIAADISTSGFPNNVYVCWTKFTNSTRYSQIYFARKRAGQSAFDNIQAISSLADGLGSNPEVVQGSYVIVGSDGVAYFFWYRRNPTTGVGRLWMNKTIDGGATFAGETELPFGDITHVQPYVLGTNGTTQFQRAVSFPVAAIRPSGSGYDIFLAWSDYVNQKVRIYYSRSFNHVTWTAKTELYENSGIQRFLPTVTASPSGTIYLAYYNRVSTATNYIQCEVAQSDDGGATFAPPQVAGLSDFDGFNLFTGDYIGIAANNNTYWAIWPGLVGNGGSVPYNNDIFGTYKAVYVTVRNELAGSSNIWYNGIQQTSPYSTYDVHNAVVSIKASNPVPSEQNYLALDRWLDENNNLISTTQITNVTLDDSHTYRAMFLPAALVTVKNEFKEPNGTTSNGGKVYIDGVEHNVESSGQFQGYLSITNHTFDAREQQKGSYWRGFNPRPDQNGGWEIPTPPFRVYDQVISPVVQTATYLGHFRNRYGLTLQSLGYVEPGSGGYYKVDGTNQGTSWNGNIWQYESRTLEAVLPNSNWFARWSDGSTENPRLYSATNNAALFATCKLHLASSSPDALAKNTQRKIIRDSFGQLHMVYQSAGLIWYTRSLNQSGTSWAPEKLVSPMFEGYPEYILYRDPTIVYVPRVETGDGGGDGIDQQPDIQEDRIRVAYEIYAADESEHGIYVCELDLDGNITYGPEQAGALWEGEGNHARPVLGVVPDYVSPYHPPGAYYTLLAWYQAEGNALRCSAWLYDNQFYFTTDLVTGVSEFSLAPYSMEANTWHLAFIQENNVKYMPVVWRDSYLERGDVETVAEGDESVYYHNPCIASVNANVYGNPIAIAWQAYYWEFVTGGVKYSERLSRQEGWTSPTAWMPYADATFQKPTITGSARYNLTAVYRDALLAWQNETTSMYSARGRAGTGWEKVTGVGTGGDPTLSAAFNNGSTTEILLSRGGNGPYTMQYQGLEATDNPLSATEGRSGRILLRNGMVHIAVLDAELDRATLNFVRMSDTARIPLSRFEDVFATEAFAGTGLLKVRTLFAAKGEVQGGITMRVTLRDAATGQVVQTLRTFHVGEDTVLSFEASLNYGSRQLRLVLQPVGIAQARWIDIERWFVVKETTPLGKQSASATATNELPKEFAVHPNYPNPFNPSTTIKFDLPEPSHVSLVIYDVLGRKVVELENGVKDAGYHNVQWSTDNGQLSSGVYFARFVATDANGSVRLSKVSKLLLTK